MIAAGELTFYKSAEGYRQAMAVYERMLAEVRHPVERCFVETRFGRTHVLLYGPAVGRPVLLFHGMGASAPTFWFQINALAEHYRVIVPDMPGAMGRSAAVRLERQGPAYGQWALDVLAALAVEQAAVIGISLGGWQILKLAAVAPQRIDRAVLMSSAGFVGPDWRLFFKMGPMLLRAPFLSGEQQAAHFAQVMGAPGVTPHPHDRAMFTAMLAHFRYEQAPPPLGDAGIQCLTAPTYLLMGEHEAAFTPEKVLARARALLPNLVKAEIMAGVGHGMITEDPAGVNDRLLAFLKES